MLLCVDIGNTQIALGLYADTTSVSVARPPLIRDWRMRTDPRMTADELDVAVRALLGQYAPQVSAIAALSTVPSLLRELRLLLDRRTDLPSVVVGPGVRTGVPLLVDNPREVGADRVVTARGEFLGGALAPGIEISMEALAARAAALRTVELVPPRSVIGKNTVECLQSGVLYGFAGQVDGLVRRILAELDAGPVTVLGTGGLAPLMAGESETITTYVPDLTLLGLRLTYLRNPGGSRPDLPTRRSTHPH